MDRNPPGALVSRRAPHGVVRSHLRAGGEGGNCLSPARTPEGFGLARDSFWRIFPARFRTFRGMRGAEQGNHERPPGGTGEGTRRRSRGKGKRKLPPRAASRRTSARQAPTRRPRDTATRGLSGRAREQKEATSRNPLSRCAARRNPSQGLLGSAGRAPKKRAEATDMRGLQEALRMSQAQCTLIEHRLQREGRAREGPRLRRPSGMGATGAGSLGIGSRRRSRSESVAFG